MDRDESIREGASADSPGALRTSFRPEGIVMAGNASPLSDGAAALLLASRSGLEELGVEPLARVVATGVDAVEPHRFGIGSVQAVWRAVSRSGRTLADLDVMELNEAFAAQSLPA